MKALPIWSAKRCPSIPVNESTNPNLARRLSFRSKVIVLGLIMQLQRLHPVPHALAIVAFAQGVGAVRRGNAEGMETALARLSKPSEKTNERGMNY